MNANAKLPLVSICIPAYNHEKYVQETIQSIIDQDYPRIELIVIDDGSKDGTWAKIQEMRSACEKRFERVVMQTRKNCGVVKTLKELISLSEGEIIGDIASDDKYLCTAISTLVNAMTTDENIGVVVGVNTLMDASGKRCYWDKDRNIVYDSSAAKYKTFDEFIASKTGVDPKSAEFGKYEKLVSANHVPNCYLIRGNVLRGISFPEDISMEDWWMHLQLSKITQYKYVPVETFCYRWHETNTSLAGERMGGLITSTRLHELECLNQSSDSQVYIESFKKTLPIVERVVGLQIGKHCPRIEKRHYFDFMQYCLVISRFVIPISYKIR